MTTENKILDLSFEAAEDLTSDQYKFVVLTSAGKVRRPDSETEVALGILQKALYTVQHVNVSYVAQPNLLS